MARKPRISAEDRMTVERMASCGEGDETIARAFGITVEALRKTFDDELKNGAARQRRAVIDMLYKNAEGGNISAQKRLEEMQREALMPAEAVLPGRTSGAKLGKKEQAVADAMTPDKTSPLGQLIAARQGPGSDAIN